MSHLLTNTGFVGSLVAPSITPASFAGLEGWWKADSLALGDGAQIGGAGSEWLDETANNHDCTQGTAANRPLFQTNEVGSMPIVQFADTTDLLTVANTFSIAGNWTIAVLVGQISVAGCVPLRASGNTGYVRIFESSANNMGWRDTGGTVQTVPCSYLGSTYRLLIWTRSGTNVICYENNVNIGTVTNGEGLTNYNQMGSNNIGKFAEICVWSSELSAAHINSIYVDYFQPRWGLP